MGNQTLCGAAPQQCVDECARLQFETRSRDPDDPECDPAGAVFNDTLQGLVSLDKEALRFAGKSNLSAVRWLLSMGANAKARDRNGTTMLHAACRSGSCLIVQELVKQGVPLEVQDSSGWTPLHVAAVMGRRDLALLLVRVRANVSIKNKKGQTPLAICSDLGTKEVLDEFSTEPKVARPHPKPFLADNLLSNPGGNNDDYTVTCEPFFVPRLPLCHNEAHRPEVVHLGVDLFRKSAGHGLAFFVATGAVHDHPTDLSEFLVANKVDPVQLGEFLGEDFSLAQTLRLAFIHAVDVTNTGILGALLKAFRHMRAPLDLGKVDRITGAVAHLWWRTHGEDADECFAVDGEDLDWSMFSEDLGAGADGEGGMRARLLAGEPVGARLRQSLRSVEGLRRLMFSTLMLCWNVKNKCGLFAGAVSPRRLSLPAWLDMNVGIEADGSNIPIHVQKGIYHAVTEQQGGLSRLLPVEGDGGGAAEECRGGSASSSPGPTQGASSASAAVAVQDVSLLVQGWAAIPRGGLEHSRGCSRSFFGGAVGGGFGSRGGSASSGGGSGGGGSGGAGGGSGRRGGRLASSVLSEASSSQAPLPLEVLSTSGGQSPTAAPSDPAEGAEPVWLTLRLSLFLFFATSPDDVAPYAFVRLQDAVLQDVDRRSRHLVLVGRLPEEKPRARPSGVTSSGAPQQQAASGADARMPLPLCFLLADGRFQLFEAMGLELRFPSDEELDMWVRELGVACGGCQQQPVLRRPAGQHRPSGPSAVVVAPDDGGDLPTFGVPLPRVLQQAQQQPAAPPPEPSMALDDADADCFAAVCDSDLYGTAAPTTALLGPPLHLNGSENAQGIVVNGSEAVALSAPPAG